MSTGESSAGGSATGVPRWSRWCATHPRTATGLAALLFLLVAPWSLRLPTDNAPETYFPADHEALEWLAASRTAFDPGRWIRIVASGEDLWTREGLAWAGGVEAAAAAIDGIERSLGPAGRYPDEPWPPVDPEAFRSRLRESPLARDLGWIDPGGSALSILLRLEPDAPIDRTVSRLKALLAEREIGGRRLYSLGLPILEQALDDSSREIVTLFFPLLGVVVLLVLAVALRSLRDVVAGLLYVVFSLGTVLGGFERAGGSLSLVLSVLPPILFVVTLATAVHLIVRVRNLCGEATDSGAAVEQALAEKGRAVFWTGATTAVGFAALATAPVGPVRALGITAALGIGWATLTAFTVLPALLVLVGGSGEEQRRPGPFEIGSQRLARAAAAWSCRHRGLVLAVGALLAAASVALLPRLGAASNTLEYLPADAPLRRAVAAADSRGLPSASVDLLVEPAGALDLGSAAGLAHLLELGRSLEAVDGVVSVLGPGTLLAEARALSPGLAGPAGDAFLVAALKEDSRSRELLDGLVAADGRLARLTLGVRAGGYPELDRLLVRVTEAARRVAPDLVIHPTGEYPLVLETQRSLLATLGTSFLVSLATILTIFLAMLRSLRWSLVALAPSVLPVLLAFGVLAASGRPLDIATVMVAAVILGLAVDDTIHTLLATRSSAVGATVVDAVAANGAAFTLTALILAAGFGVCGFSDFAPTARFGGLASLAMALVWVGALFLLPALVSVADRDGS